LRIPARKFKELTTSYWANYERYQALMSKYLTGLLSVNANKQYDLLKMFKEHRFYAGHSILTEGM